MGVLSRDLAFSRTEAAALKDKCSAMEVWSLVLYQRVSTLLLTYLYAARTFAVSC